MGSFDFHSHSSFSDGLYPPAEVIRRAAANNPAAFALTDHDTLDGLAQARFAAQTLSLSFIDGVEISTTWMDKTLHIVGLGIDPGNNELAQGLHQVRTGRVERAQRMADALARIGIGGCFEGSMVLASNPHLVGRTHFARYLVSQGMAKDTKAVFRKYLVPGKPGYVKHSWATIEEATRWIHKAGGVAVLAHPGRYDIGPNAMKRLLDEFKSVGGDAVEVITSNHTREQAELFARHAQHFGLHASAGSDFHGDEGDRVAPGRTYDLPTGVKPIWELLRHTLDVDVVGAY